MSEIFISYARSTELHAKRIAEALKTLGYGVWRDDELPAHRAYSDVLEERLKAAKAVVVLWSAEAAKSEWVRSEADRARSDRKLVQLTLDGSALPMPFDQIQCADLAGWAGDANAAGWRKVVASVAELVGKSANMAAPTPSRAGAPPAGEYKPSIAVLPFANLSGDPEQAYFTDGMVDEITTALSRQRSIFVVTSGSGQALQGQGLSPQETAGRLGVRYLLEGSVRKSANRVRIAVKLIDGADGTQLWAERFEDTLDDVFDLQDKVALAVAGKIEPTVQSAEIERVSARQAVTPGSYDFALRALPYQRTFEKAGTLKAIELLDQSIALDPNYGRALGLAAACHSAVVTFGWSENPEGHRQQGLEMARRALKTAGDDATVLAACAGTIASLAGDWDEAIALAAKAIALNPGSCAAWVIAGSVRLQSGDTEGAVHSLETALRLDPMGPYRPSLSGYLAIARFRQRRFTEAAALAQECLRHSDNPNAHAILAASYGYLGEAAASRALARFKEGSSQSAEAYARSTILQPENRQLFLDGIALAEGGG